MEDGKLNEQKEELGDKRKNAYTLCFITVVGFLVRQTRVETRFYTRGLLRAKGKLLLSHRDREHNGVKSIT